MGRHAGVLVPLFSISSRASWGAGEMADLPHLGAWLAAGGFDRLMLLPIGTMPPGETSPYSAISTMAIDPLYVSVPALPDFAEAGGVAALPPEASGACDAARRSARVRYAGVRAAKTAALDLAFEWFERRHTGSRSPRAQAFDAYVEAQSWWLQDYACYQAIAGVEGPSWRAWPTPLRDRDPAAIAGAAARLSGAIRREQYGQWVAESQWQSARRALAGLGVTVIGDLPFGLGVDSPEVWARAGEFDLHVSVGVPPDAFSETGQDWRLPMYRWDVIAQTDYEMLRRRGRRMAALYGGFRIDHLVGYFRTYGRPVEGEPFFRPETETDQIVQGLAAIAALRAGGAETFAEDLGVVPDFVRAAMVRAALPGCKVLRWERAWDRPDRPFRDPAAYPAASMAVTGTHDLEPLAAWWEAASAADRAQAARLPALAAAGVSAAATWSDSVRDAWLAAAFGTGSDDLFLPIQDVFGWRDRVNTPATVSDANWTWKLPWPIDDWPRVPEAVERAAFCRRAIERRRDGPA